LYQNCAARLAASRIGEACRTSRAANQGTSDFAQEKGGLSRKNWNLCRQARAGRERDQLLGDFLTHNGRLHPKMKAPVT
jgi:hypothetical protein